MFYGSGSVTPEHEMAAKYIEEARSFRKKYYGGHGVKSSFEKKKTETLSECSGKSVANDKDGNEMDDRKLSASEEPAEGMVLDTPVEESSPPRLEYVFGSDGVVEIYDATDFRRENNLVTVPPLSSFVEDYQRLVEITSSGAMRSFTFQRLQMLSSAFKMHITINGAAEDEAQSSLLGTDFYRTMKVDNHIHLAAAASAKQFVNFVRDKLESEGDTGELSWRAIFSPS